MALQVYLLQIVDAETGDVVHRFAGGGRLEADLRSLVRAAILPKARAVIRAEILKRRVGLLRTTNQVAQAVDDALAEHALEDAAEEGLTDAIMALKLQTIGAGQGTAT